MRKSRISISALFIVGIFFAGSLFLNVYVNAQPIQDDTSYMGQDLSILNNPLNTTMNYSISAGEGLGFIMEDNQKTADLDVSNDLNYVDITSFTTKTYLQFNNIHKSGNGVYLDYDLFTDSWPKNLEFNQNDTWDYNEEKEYNITPTFGDLYSENMYPLDLNTSDLLPNSSAPLLIEAQQWDYKLGCSIYFSRAVIIALNEIRFDVSNTDWNYSLYRANWTFLGYSSSDEIISVNMTYVKRVSINDEHILNEEISYFKQEIAVSEPNFSEILAVQKSLEIFSTVQLKYRGNMQYSFPYITDENMDDGWTSWGGWTGWTDEQEEMTHFVPFNAVFFPFIMMGIGVIIGIIILVVIIRAIAKMGPASFPAEKSRAGYYGTTTVKTKTNAATIQEKSASVSRAAEHIKHLHGVIPKFCPVCGSPISDVMKELLQIERYAFCESCGEKITL